MQAAARFDDPIAHRSAESGLIMGALIGAGLVIGGALIIGTGGAALPFVIGAVLAGAALGGWMGEFVGSLSFFNEISGSITSGSPDIFVNYKPLARAIADIGECIKHGTEPQVIATGSETVFINFRPAARVKDKLQCSGVIAEGSPDVFIGGGYAKFTDGELGDDVAWYYRAGLLAAGVGGALLMGGLAAVPAIVGGFVGGMVGDIVMGMVGHHYGDWLSENIGGTPEDWEKTGRFVGQGIGGWLGAKGGPKAWEAINRLEVEPSTIGANGGNIRIKPKTEAPPLEPLPAVPEKPSKPVTRDAIIDKFGEVVRKRIPDIKKIDPDAQVGFRGSLARGFKGEHKGNEPFDPTDFDVDAFVVSDKLRGRGQGFQVGPKPLRNIAKDIDTELRQSPEFEGLRGGKNKLQFRIFGKKEIMRKADKGDAQIYINEEE